METSTTNQPVTISTDAPLQPASDFRFLRSEGIRFIQQLAAGTWTDHNTHDPGITILDLLCYAITDISYRLDYDIKDLLATASGNAYESLYSPAQVLTTNPVTMADYRKLLIDLEGVKNAWLEKQYGQGTVPMYYYPNTQTLSLTTEVFIYEKQPLSVKGIYNVWLAPDKSGVAQAATDRLNDTRNLCEDFNEAKELPTQWVSVSGMVEVGKTSDINKTAAGLLFRMASFISPRLRFRTLSQMLATGKTMDEIFEGPALLHGFIDDTELAAYKRKTELHVSDIIREMMDEPGVLFVNGIALTTPGAASSNDWLLKLDADKVVDLDVPATLKQLIFKKSNAILTVNAELVKSMVQTYQQEVMDGLLPKKDRDRVVAEGNFQPLGKYHSIQHHFPQTYGIGDSGLPESASELRKAQAAQLKGYLLFFEQILASYSSQIEGLKDLFSFTNHSARTYFCQPLRETVPGVTDIFQSGNRRKIAAFMESSEEANLRKNRFLNHLIARFGDSLSEYSLNAYSYRQWRLNQSSAVENDAQDTVLQPADTDQYTGEVVQHAVSKKLVADKLRFLANYPQISNGRGKAINYAKNINDSSNYSGLQKRIAAKLGIESTGWWNPADGAEGFYLVEHILLRPTQEDVSATKSYITDHPAMLTPTVMERFENGAKGRVNCFSKAHGLLTGDQIIISQSKNYPDGVYSITYLTADSFSISATYKTTPEVQPVVWQRLIGPGMLYFRRLIEHFEDGKKDKDGKDQVNCLSKAHGLQTGNKIIISQSKNYAAGIYNVTVADSSSDNFLIAATYTANPEDNPVLWGRLTDAQILALSKPVERFENGGKDREKKEQVNCFAKAHGLQTGDKVIISQSKNYTAGIYTVTYLTPDSFSIPATYTADPEDKTVTWIRFAEAENLAFSNEQIMQADFFSLQLTCVFPKEIGRFKNDQFRAFVENTVRKETPAHLTVYVRWTATEAIKQFGMVFRRFLDEKAGLNAFEEATVAKRKLPLRSYRNRLTELLIPQTYAYPLADIPIPQPELIVQYNQPGNIVLPYTQLGMLYMVTDEYGNKMNGSGDAGTDGPLKITTSKLKNDRYTLSIDAIDSATRLSTRLYQSVSIRIGINTDLEVSVKGAPIVYGSKAIVVIKDAQSDTTYQLLDAGKKPLSAAITTDADVIHDLEITTTDAVLEDTEVTISVTSTHAAQNGTLNAKPVITVLPNTNLKPVLEKPVLDYGATANVVLAGTQTTATYQLYRQDIDDDTVNKEVVPIGQPLPGKSAKLKLPIPNLTEDLVVSIVARKTASGFESALPDSIVVLVKPDISKQLSIVETDIKAGDTATIRVSNTQRGILYQLRQVNEDKTFTNIGNPAYHHKNYGIGKARLEVDFALDLFTNDFVLLPTGIINKTTTFNVLAIKATTRQQAEIGNITIEIKS